MTVSGMQYGGSGVPGAVFSFFFAGGRGEREVYARDLFVVII